MLQLVFNSVGSVAVEVRVGRVTRRFRFPWKVDSIFMPSTSNYASVMEDGETSSG